MRQDGKSAVLSVLNGFGLNGFGLNGFGLKGIERRKRAFVSAPWGQDALPICSSSWVGRHVLMPPNQNVASCHLDLRFVCFSGKLRS